MIPPGAVVNAAGGALFVALGVWAASLRPRRPTTRWLGAFCAGFGLFYVFQNLLYADLPDAWWRLLALAYRATVEGALLDGAITERERDMLARLRDQLGLTGNDALDVEREAARGRASI